MPSTIFAENFSYRKLIALTFPQLLMMFFQMLIGFVDVYVAGKINSHVQASIGLSVQFLMFLLVISGTISSAVMATVGQSVGAGRLVQARRYAALSLILGTFFCLFIIVGVALFQNQLLDLAQVDKELRPVAVYFLTIILYSLPAQYALGITSAIFRANGKVFIPLLAIFLACIINTVADFGFGLGYFGMPNMGYKGIAWASFFAVTAAALSNIIMLAKDRLLSKDAIPGWNWAKHNAPYFIKVSVPAGLMQTFWNLGYIVLYVVVGTLPFDRIYSLAGLTTGLRVESILFLPGVAFNMTAAIVVSNLLGAEREEEAKKAAMRLLVAGCTSMSLLAVLVWFMAPTIVMHLAPNPLVQPHTLAYLHFNLLSTPFTICSMILTGVLIGAGATTYSFIVNTVSIWLVRLPAAYALGHIFWQTSSGVFFSMLISQMFMSLSLLYIFKYKNWTRFKMSKSLEPQAKELLLYEKP